MTQNIETPIPQIPGNEPFTLIHAKISRDISGKVTIFLKGKSSLWNFLKTEKCYQFFGVDCHIPCTNSLRGIKSVIDVESGYEKEGYLNLAFLLAKDLDNGVTFDLGTFPISEQKFTQIIDNFYEQVNVLFLTYARPVECSLNIEASFLKKTVVP